MKKKIASFALAAVCAMSMGTSAFAADTEVSAPDATTGKYSATVDSTTTVKTPTIKITVPGDLGVAINPYQIEVSVDSEDLSDPISSKTHYLTNESDVPIKVGVTASAALGTGSNAVIATTNITKPDAETKKSVFAYLRVAESADNSTALDLSDGYQKTDVIFTNKATTTDNLYTMPAGADTATYAAYRVGGVVATNPASAWGATDTIDYKIVFNFTPEIVPDAAP